MKQQRWIFGVLNYSNESEKRVKEAVDKFSPRQIAIVCKTNRADKINKFFKSYISNNGVPRKIHVAQGTNLMSKTVRSFYNNQGFEIIQLPVRPQGYRK